MGVFLIFTKVTVRFKFNSLILFILSSLVLLISCQTEIDVINKGINKSQPKTSILPKITGLEEVKVSRVVDGDTFIINNNQRVRLIGLDAPESVKPNESPEFLGIAASNFTKKMLTGKYVYLEKDISETDKFGRLLRYVYLKDGTFYNELLIQKGYAESKKYPPDIKYANILFAAQKSAVNNKSGLWQNYN